MYNNIMKVMRRVIVSMRIKNLDTICVIQTNNKINNGVNNDIKLFDSCDSNFKVKVR